MGGIYAFVLIVVGQISGYAHGPVLYTAYFQTAQACEAARAEMHDQFMEAHAYDVNYAAKCYPTGAAP